jgi:hypothetical protein
MTFLDSFSSSSPFGILDRTLCGNFFFCSLSVRAVQGLRDAKSHLKCAREAERRTFKWKIMKSITQQSNELQSGGIEVICRAGILESTRRHAHLQLGHMCISAVEHDADEARLAVGESG